MKKKFIKAGIVVSVCLLGLSACSSGENNKDEKSTKEGTYTIDVFSTTSNYMGKQKGWFGNEVKDKFDLELNIIAPNVAGSGDTLYQTRTAAGNLGDLIITDTGQKFNELIEAGLLYDLTDIYNDKMKNVQSYDDAVQYLNKDKNGVFGIPVEVTNQSPLTPSEGIDLNVGPYIRWDLYGQIGYPELNTLEDLLPVLSDMQKKEPTTTNGKKVYGFSMFSDWDGDYLAHGIQLAQLYGYSSMGFVLSKANEQDYQDILNSNSLYMRALKFYYEANQMELVDPESTTQNWDTVYSKFKDGQVLYSWFPFLGQSAYNISENTEAGKGFMLASIKDQKNLSEGAKINGGNLFVGIGAKAEDPSRIAEFIDWLYSPEGITSNMSQLGGTAGLKDEMWKVGENDQPELTDLGKEIFISKGAETQIPEQFGGGTYNDGISTLNIKPVLGIDHDPSTDSPYLYQMWESYQQETMTPLKKNWSEHMNSAMTAVEFLEGANQIAVAPGATYVTPEDSSEIATLRNQIGETIKEFSWKMIFAKNENEFNKLQKEMQDTAKGLGYDDVLKIDMDRAKEQTKLREEVVKEFNS